MESVLDSAFGIAFNAASAEVYAEPRDDAAKRRVKINKLNRSGIHDIPHQIGSKVIIQYCED